MFRATIKDANLSFGPAQRKVFKEFLTVNEGRTLIIELEKKGRSRSQNSYYWVFLGVIARESGDNADDLHEFFKRKLLPPKFIKVRGEEVKIPASTTELGKADFSDYITKISILTEIPTPNPEDVGYISNY